MKKVLLLFFITALPLFGSDLNYTIEHLSDGTETEAKTLLNKDGYQISIERDENSFYGNYQIGSAGEYFLSSIEYNTPPEINISDSITLLEDTSQKIPFLFFDAEGDELNITVSKNGFKGYLSIEDEYLIYSPFNNLNGSDFVTLQFDDGFDEVIEKNISIFIQGIDDSPVLADISDISMEEDSGAKTISLSVSDVDSYGTPTFFITSSNLDIAEISVIGNNLKITPKDNKFGSSTIGVTAYLGGSSSSTEKFNLNILPVDDDPILNNISDIEIAEDSEERTILFSLTDKDSDISKANYSFEVSNTEILNVVLFESSLKIIPKENKFGETEITLTASLDGKTVSDNFTISVLSVDDILVLDELSDVIRDENSVTYFVPIYISDLDSNIADTEFSINSTNPEVADIKISENGIEITPRENMFGETEITLTASLDGKTVLKNFKYTVIGFNTAPVIFELDNLSFETSVSENIETVSVKMEDDIGIAKFSAVSSNPEIISVETDLEKSEIYLRILKEVVGEIDITVIAEDSEGERTSKVFTVKIYPNQAQICLERAKTELDFSKISGENSSQNYITKDLNLIEIMDDCDEIVSINWESSESNVISDSGKVVINKEKDFIVQLSANLESADFTAEKRFLLTVPKEEFSDEVLLEKAKENITFESIREKNSMHHQIYSDLNLYEIGSFDTEISWNSSPNIISESGSILRNSNDTPVILFATITKGEISTQKTFNLVVKSLKSEDSDIVSDDFDWLTTSKILGLNRNSENIKTNLSLYSTGVNGSDILWTSSNDQVITTSGTILRDSSNDTYVQLIANISRGDFYKQKEFLLKVLKEIPEDDNTMYSFNRIESSSELDKKIVTLFAKDLNSSQEVESTIEISSAILSETFIDEDTLKTFIEGNSSTSTIYLNSDGTVETRIETTNGTNDIFVKAVGGKIEIDQNGTILIDSLGRDVFVEENGVIQHSVNKTVATSKLVGSSVLVSEDNIQTSYQSISENESNKVILKALVETSNDEKTKTSFTIINLENGQKIELDQTLSDKSHFSEDSKIEINKNINGEIEITIKTKLVDNLFIE
ncbi:hypothetical protein ThvES_00015790 [Thiovulum sp. ES]|nr:hypothetical protein ThvES_00015790 [Thiovulum sp. ES]